MGLIAKGVFGCEQVYDGVFMARCFSVIDLGTQASAGNAGLEYAHRVCLSWEVFGEDDYGRPLMSDDQTPLIISKSYKASLSEKAKLRKHISAWRGRDFTDQEAKAFQLSPLLDQYCMINITKVIKNKKERSYIAGLSPLPRELWGRRPAPVLATVLFDLDAPDLDLFRRFDKKLQDIIRKSPKWSRAHAKPGSATLYDVHDLPF